MRLHRWRVLLVALTVGAVTFAVTLVVVPMASLAVFAWLHRNKPGFVGFA